MATVWMLLEHLQEPRCATVRYHILTTKLPNSARRASRAPPAEAPNWRGKRFFSLTRAIPRRRFGAPARARTIKQGCARSPTTTEVSKCSFFFTRQCPTASSSPRTSAVPLRRLHAPGCHHAAAERRVSTAPGRAQTARSTRSATAAIGSPSAPIPWQRWRRGASDARAMI
jgi:hypothetical protein